MKTFLQNPHCKKRLQYAFLLALSMTFSMLLLAYRVHFSDTITYVFLSWNLFLACVPFVISSYIVIKAEDLSKWRLFALMMAWLVFFPNAPYIITDLFHLDQRPR